MNKVKLFMYNVQTEPVFERNLLIFCFVVKHWFKKMIYSKPTELLSYYGNEEVESAVCHCMTLVF